MRTKKFLKRIAAFFSEKGLIRIQPVKYFLSLQHEISEAQYKLLNEVSHNHLMDRTINPQRIMLSLELLADARLKEEFQSMMKKIKSFVLSL